MRAVYGCTRVRLITQDTSCVQADDGEAPDESAEDGNGKLAAVEPLLSSGVEMDDGSDSARSGQ